VGGREKGVQMMAGWKWRRTMQRTEERDGKKERKKKKKEGKRMQKGEKMHEESASGQRGFYDPSACTDRSRRRTRH
jgi:hypothetical protein